MIRREVVELDNISTCSNPELLRANDSNTGWDLSAARLSIDDSESDPELMIEFFDPSSAVPHLGQEIFYASISVQDIIDALQKLGIDVKEWAKQ